MSRPPTRIRRIQRDAIHTFVADLGYSLASASTLIGMDYDDMRRLACGEDGATPYHLSRFLVLHEIELQKVEQADMPAVLTRQWYRATNLINGIAKYHLERSRSGASGRKWRAAHEPGALP